MGQIQTCPRRMKEWGPWEHAENLDSWDQIGPDRVCNFCGSMHPDDFEKVLRRALTDKTVRIAPSDKGYKTYIWRKEIQNASFGAIKFYAWHRGDKAWQERVLPLLTEAVELSRQRLREWIDDNFKNQHPPVDE